MQNSAVRLKPNIGNILFFLSSCSYRSPLTVTVSPCSFSKKKKKWPNYASGQKSAPNSDSFWVRRLFNVCVRIFCATNATILLVYIPAKIKMSFNWKYDFFAKIGIFCKSITGPLPNVVQVYTQKYSFGWRIKLIICQIRYELSVIIYEIRTSCKKKKNVRWRTLWKWWFFFKELRYCFNFKIKLFIMIHPKKL